MNRQYAFIDEYGAFGYNFDQQGCSTHFIISAVLVKGSDLPFVEKAISDIRFRYFQQGEMKSSKVGKNHSRRIIILKEITKLPLHFFVFVCDKRKIYHQSGLRFKQSFYKFLNEAVYRQLKVAFPSLIVTADAMGGNEYLESFSKYMKGKSEPLDLFDDTEFGFQDSKKNVLVQVADMVSGSLAYSYDEKKKLESRNNDYKSILRAKILRIVEFPQSFEDFEIPKKDISPEYNEKIAGICYRQAKNFIMKNQDTTDVYCKEQVEVLQYLLFRFMNNSMRQYIPTKEILGHLSKLGYDNMSIYTFRNRIIAKLRDADVIISSSKTGYKIPSTKPELYDFIDHGKGIIVPMLERLRKCNDIIKLGTNGDLCLFSEAQMDKLIKYIQQ